MPRRRSPTVKTHRIGRIVVAWTVAALMALVSVSTVFADGGGTIFPR